MRQRRLGIEALVVALFSLPLLARGVQALLTQEAWLSGRNSAPHHYTDVAAIQLGAAFVALAAMAPAGWLASVPRWRKAGMGLLVAAGLVALVCFGLALTAAS